MAELLAMAEEVRAMAKIVARALVQALESGAAATVLELWGAHRAKVVDAVPFVGAQVVAFVLVSVAGMNACTGRVSECHGLLAMMRALFMEGDAAVGCVHPLVAALVASVCVSVASMCAAAGAADVARDAAAVCQVFQTASKSTSASSNDKLEQGLQLVCEEAMHWRRGNAMLSLGVLRKMLRTWGDAEGVKRYTDDFFSDLLSRSVFRDKAEAPSFVLADREIGNSLNRDSLEDALRHEMPPPCNSPEEKSSLVALASILIGTLSHSHAQVRYAACRAISQIGSSPSRLFFLPAVVTQMQKESSGVIVTMFLRDILLPRCLLAQKQTSKVVMKTMIQLAHPGKGMNATATYHTGLLAIAAASKSAPGIASSVLLAEVENLKSSFEALHPTTKCAACAAVLEITTIRPTRGASFVPFIMRCTTKETMQAAPLAAAFCFDSIRVMAENEVLDATKAVKVILKTFPNTFEVAIVARRSYLRLLGCVSSRSETKKGAVIAGKAIDILKGCLVDGVPSGDNSEGVALNWRQIDVAASALAEYTTDEILRMAHAGVEPLDDANDESKRLESISAECQQFIINVLSTTGSAMRHHSHGMPGMRKLLEGMAKHEWDNRQRSSFDPKRIAKLRAASEALRRSRRKAQTAQSQVGVPNLEAAEEDRPTAQFIRAVSTLPTGAIRGFCARCAFTSSEAATFENTADSLRETRAVAIDVLQTAGALSPALPWLGLVEDILESSSSVPAERAAALRALAQMQDSSFATNHARMRWFGGSECTRVMSAIQETIKADERREAREALLGMTMYQSAELGKVLEHVVGGCSASATLAIVIDALAATDGPTESFVSQVRVTLQTICTAGVKLDEATQKIFVDGCLKRLDLEIMRASLIELVPSPVAIRLSCLTHDYKLLRACANAVVCDGIDMSNKDGMESVSMLGAELQRMEFAQRMAVAQDLAGKRAYGRPVGKELVASCLGTAAILPDGDGCLVAASALCGEKERGLVGAVVDSLMRREL
ncbi:unnamed protein product [Chondrus crispus]|uniref:Uncharacterized protein n=1 Tax=Chondrus crispus TaxID=2769 RepID=R7Q4M8_CHOCR|nr:unnamed protein product [Chondrus crispus]CDF32326.1 unnamed protein product [Chondrus crispus]|eukprot:XP_005711991.1 unnamed protein product [Chondrus crispus]